VLLALAGSAAACGPTAPLAPSRLADGHDASKSYVPDRDPPKITAMSFDRPSYLAGDEAKVTITATDDVSGLGDFFNLLFSGDGVFTQVYDFDGGAGRDLGGGAWEFTFAFNEYLPSAHVRPVYTQLQDKAGRYVTYQLDAAGRFAGTDVVAPTIALYGADPDLDAPIIDSVELASPDVVAGDKARLIVGVTESGSGVGDTFVQLINAETGRTRYAQVAAADVVTLPDGRYALDLPIDRWSDPGDTYVALLDVQDRAQHGAFLQTEDQRVFKGSDLLVPHLNVVNDRPDRAAPTLVGLELAAPPTLHPGDVLHATVRAHDDVSGVGPGAVGLSFHSVDGRTALDATVTDVEPTGDETLELTIRIGRWSELGDFAVDQVYLGDAAQNTASLKAKNGVYEGTTIAVPTVHVEAPAR
jgi:hypothetical protein